jgi:hypothetical protein
MTRLDRALVPRASGGGQVRFLNEGFRVGPFREGTCPRRLWADKSAF